ncbi:MAG: hypothetical protein ABI877_17570 [Gemmatimonadaceae bacterium]
MLARLVGLYLSLCYIMLPVAALFLWRRGQVRLALGLLAAPLAAWGLWEISGEFLTPFKRAHLGIGLIPVVIYFQLAPLAWLVWSAEATGSVSERTSSDIGDVARTLLPVWVWAAIVLVGSIGVLWFFYGLFNLEASCSIGGTSEGLVSQLPQAALCVSSAAGTWPLLLPLMLVAVVAFVRKQTAEST